MSDILRYLDICNGHLSKSTFDFVNSGGIKDVYACSVAPYEYGVFLTVPSIETDISDPTWVDRCPEDLLAVIKFARGPYVCPHPV
jgi:hypothetical protein